MGRGIIKIHKKAPPYFYSCSSKGIAKFYTDAFFDDCRKLNIKTPDVVQPATGCIDEYIRIISKLVDTGYAYLACGRSGTPSGRRYTFPPGRGCGF